MYERLDACPLCNHTTMSNKMVVKDHAISKESFVIVECDKCRFQFTNPRPTASQLSKYYESPDYISHASSAKSIMDLLYRLARQYMLRKKLGWIKSLASTDSSLLDFGCGTGSFLNVCRNAGWQVKGVEPNAHARATAEKLNIPVFPSLNEMPQDQQFSVITLWHVLEHIADLHDTMNQLRQLLKANGHLVLALPNHRAEDANLFGEHWAGYDVPRHLYHFTPDDVKTLARNYHFSIVKTLPLKLDAYYVSLLSAKYQNTSSIKSLQTAFRSNTKAGSTGNYSSLVYILKK